MAFNGKILNALVDNAKILSRAKHSKSISRLSKDSIMPYPLIFSTAISPSDAADIAPGHERNCAGMLLAYFSLNNAISLSNFQSVGDYLKSFSEGSVPDEIAYMDNLITSAPKLVKGAKESIDDVKESGDYAIESIVGGFIDEGNFHIATEEILSLWDCTEDALNTTPLNSLYKPYTQVQRACEAFLDDLYSRNRTKNMNNNFGITNTSTKVSTKIDANGLTTRTAETNELGVVKNIDKNAPKITNDKKLSSMEPTWVQCEFVLHGPGKFKGGAGQMVQTAVFGVKAMSRFISSDIMVNEITRSLQSKNPILKFVQWAKGEKKLIKDLIFGIEELKTDAKTRKNGSRIFASLRARARKNKMAAVNGDVIPATTTLIISAAEAEAIKQASGYDLYDDNIAQQFIQDQFLLGFGILDSETEVLSIMYDAYDGYTDVTLGTLRSSGKSDMNISNVKDVLKLIGRL